MIHLYTLISSPSLYRLEILVEQPEATARDANIAARLHA